MKKILKFLAIFCLAMVQTVFAQNINLKFKGATNDGKYVQLDSVRIENISRSWTETLVYPDTVLSFSFTGIGDAQNKEIGSGLESYPNPFDGTTHVSLTLSQNEAITLQVYNIAGQRIMDKRVRAEAGENLFELSLQHTQVYFLIVNTSNGRLVQKLINLGNFGDNSISYLGTKQTTEIIQTKTQKLLSAKEFQMGDILCIRGFATHNGNVVASNEILQPQTTGENFTLFFALQATASLPTLSTTAASNITNTTATSGGNITNDGGAAIVARGVCWATCLNPTINNSHTTDGNGTGSFTSNLTYLTAGITYNVRAYATNSAGTAYGNQITFTTPIRTPTLTTIAVSNITSATATSGGNITSDGGATVVARGVCWATYLNPTINDSHTTDGNGTGSFTSSITDLTAGKTYYVRAYATNSAGTAYGNQITFTTSSIDTTSSDTTSSIGIFSVSSTVKVLFSPGNLQWSATNGGSTYSTHTIAGGGTDAGTWRFAPNQWDTIGANYNYYSGWIDLFGWGTSGYNGKYPDMVSITATDYGNGNNDILGTDYDWGVYNAIYNPHTNTTDAPGIWRALTIDEWVYLLNTRSTSSGIRYAKAKVMGINGVIIVPNNWSTSVYALKSTNTTNAAYTTNIITYTDWIKMENAGCVFLPAAGCRYGASVHDVGSDGYYSSGTCNGSNDAYFLHFDSDLLGLAGGTGRSRGISVRLVRSADSIQTPTISTTTVRNITGTTATSGGNITSDGGATVTARGVCWSTSSNPTVSNSHTTDGNGTGSFTSSITGLTAGTTYYVRAYATNAAGTAYGNQITFTASIRTPTLSTTVASNIMKTTATSGGNITSDGGATVTARGVCWSTSSRPTVSNSHTTEGNGIGSFTSSITGLTAGTTYYVRAYATNSAGTAYGNQVSFTTLRVVFVNVPFSVSSSRKVYFSPGNLQWSAKNGGSTATTHAVRGGGTAAGTWRFAPNQWDTIGANNKNISSTYSGWIDLFGWGTSGYNNKYPYMTSTTSSDYGNGDDYISGSNYDWGRYNAIYNPQTNTTDAPDTWHTLTKDEWVYLMNTRSTSSGIRYAKATVMGVEGLIIVPDNWSTSVYALKSTNTANADYTTNIITYTDWAKMENAGCVFLPAAGDRDGTSARNVGAGYYWSGTYYDSGKAYNLWVHPSYLDPSTYSNRYYGYSVRLVRDVQ